MMEFCTAFPWFCWREADSQPTLLSFDQDYGVGTDPRERDAPGFVEIGIRHPAVGGFRL